MKSSKTSFLRNCISGWNVRLTKFFPYICNPVALDTGLCAMKFFSYICNCVALDTGMCVKKKIERKFCHVRIYCNLCIRTKYITFCID